MKRKASSPLERSVKKSATWSPADDDKQKASDKKNPIEYLSEEALENLHICYDSCEEDIDYYDETNGLNIDEEWFDDFCHECGFDREEKRGVCMACGSSFKNFF